MNREECNDMVMKAYFESLTSIRVDTDKAKAIYEVQREEIRNEDRDNKELPR